MVRLIFSAFLSAVAVASMPLDRIPIGPRAASKTQGTPSAPRGPGRVLRGWGTVVDPDADCTFQVDQRRLTIVVPGVAHDLSAELKKVNAPRVMTPVEGSFIVQVRVGGEFKPVGPATMAERAPFHGAGLILWQHENNYFRFEQAAILRGDKLETFLLFEERRGATPAIVSSFPMESRPRVLRLERREGHLFPSISQDGAAWFPLKPVPFAAPQQMHVGVDAVNTASNAFTAELESFQLYTRHRPGAE